ncbi:Signal transduction histidine kinase [Streptomyces sp. Amel2xC10]|nr:Signal transduction histidine kinase [Streptomyces sp. Amel2xC10]
MACRWAAWRARHRDGDQDRCAAGEHRAPDAFGEPPGPPPTPLALLPWLLLGLGSFSNLFQGETPNPWLGGLGLLIFNSCYIYVAVRSFVKEKREAPSTRVALLIMTLVTCGLAGGYGGTWLLFFPLLGLAAGAALRGPRLRETSVGLGLLAGAVAVPHDGWGGLAIAYATGISTVVTAVILTLAEAVRELRAAREELARRAVEKERLRFSRDLHDLLGHTLSVIVVKSEAARRLAPGDLDAALAQITDIESVGRQALTEIREAVTGYREGSLPTELDRARSALTAAGVEPAVSQSGPPVEPETAALLGWVVREAVTNVVRHSAATHCTITVTGTQDRVRLTVTDDGRGAAKGATGDGPGEGDDGGGGGGGLGDAGRDGAQGLDRGATRGGRADAGRDEARVLSEGATRRGRADASRDETRVLSEGATRRGHGDASRDETRVLSEGTAGGERASASRDAAQALSQGATEGGRASASQDEAQALGQGATEGGRGDTGRDVDWVLGEGATAGGGRTGTCQDEAQALARGADEGGRAGTGENKAQGLDAGNGRTTAAVHHAASGHGAGSDRSTADDQSAGRHPGTGGRSSADGHPGAGGPPGPDSPPNQDAHPAPDSPPNSHTRSPAGRRGTGLTGLRERLAVAGGSLTAGPGARGGFTVTAELPVEAPAPTAYAVPEPAQAVPPVPAGPTLGP